MIQIGILNFTLFPEAPEFYATFQFQNVKNKTLYSDKLRISVLDLTHIELATEEDKLYQIDHWARLFKADTWEEIVMLAQKDEYISEATDTIYQLTQDEKIRMQCEAREDYYRTQRGWQSMLEERNAMLEERNGIIQKQKETIATQDNTIAEQKAALEAADMELARLLAWAKERGYET